MDAHRILVVDDEPANVLLLESLLSSWGFTDVATTTSSRQATELCATAPPDLLLLDLHMPEPDGFEVMRRLAPLTTGVPSLPIIVLTADVTQEAKRRALAAGARDFLTKPFDFAEVRLRITNLLETRSLQLSLLERTDQLAVEVAERTRERELARLEILERLALAAEYRGDDTGEHARRVGQTAGLIAAALGLDSETVDLIRWAAPLHDVGMLGIPDSVLLKPDRLTEDEFEVIKTHVTLGQRVLADSSSPLVRTAEEIALTHHERWDGTGYPRGLAGKEIPLSGQIVAVADVFDALTHERPYKTAWTVESAVAEIASRRGSDLAPDVVDAFAELDHAALVELAPPWPAFEGERERDESWAVRRPALEL
jgi:putative two-component system response regulator